MQVFSLLWANSDCAHFIYICLMHLHSGVSEYRGHVRLCRPFKRLFPRLLRINIIRNWNTTRNAAIIRLDLCLKGQNSTKKSLWQKRHTLVFVKSLKTTTCPRKSWYAIERLLRSNIVELGETFLDKEKIFLKKGNFLIKKVLLHHFYVHPDVISNPKPLKMFLM